MAETTYYDSPLTGKQLDAAFAGLAQVEQSVELTRQNAETAQQYGQIVADNAQGIRAIEENLEIILSAPECAQTAVVSAGEAETSALQAGESAASAAESAQQAQQIAQGAMGWYETEASLKAAHPTGENGQWAIIGSTDTIWTWDSDTADWVDTGDQVDLSNYYTKTQSDAAFPPKSHASTLTAYGVGSSADYGHVRLSDAPGSSGAAGGIAATPLGVQNAIHAAALDFSWHGVSGSVMNCNMQYSFVYAAYNTGARLMYIALGILEASSDRNVLVAAVPLPYGYSLAVSSNEIGALTKAGDNTVANNQTAGFWVGQSGNMVQFTETTTDPGSWAKAAIMLPLAPNA